jgi:hypothetical protein
MAASNALVPYSSSFSTSTSLTTRSTPLGLTRVFTAQTATAIATELLYRILWDILQRLLTSLQGYAGRRLEALNTYLHERHKEREALRQGKVSEELAKKKEGLGIVEAVEKLDTWGHGFPGPACPMTGEARPMRGPPGPPKWVKKAASGWTEAEWMVQVHGD